MKKVIFSIIVFLVSISFVSAKDVTLKNNYEINNKKAIIINLNKENVKKAPVIKIAQALEEKKKEIEEEIKSYTRGINDAINSFPLDRCTKLEDADITQCQNLVQTLKDRISSWDAKVNDAVNRGYFTGQNIVIINYEEAANKANEYIKKVEQELQNKNNTSTNPNSDVEEVIEEIQSYTRGLNDLVNNFKMDECKAVGAEKCQKMIAELKNKISSVTSVWNTRVDNYINQGYFSGKNIVIEEYREAVNKANEFIKNAAQDADTNLNLDTNIDFNNFCNEEGVHKTVKFLGYGLYIVKIMVPILLIIFGSIDFGKAIVSSNQDAIQKTSKILIIRIIIGIVIFLLPTIINYVFKIAGNDENAFKNCRICVLDIRNCD